MRARGSITLCIGLWRSEASTSKVVTKERPAKTPERRRMVVPELPQSMTLPGGQSPSQPLPSTHNVSPSCDIFTPRSLKACTVRRLSSPPERFHIRLLPWAMLVKITALWPIDLSPGTANSPRRGRFTSLIFFILHFVFCLDLSYLPPHFIGPGKFSLQQASLPVAHQLLQALQILEVITQTLPNRPAIDQEDVAPDFRAAGGNPSEILKAPAAVLLQVYRVHPRPA